MASKQVRFILLFLLKLSYGPLNIFRMMPKVRQNAPTVHNFTRIACMCPPLVKFLVCYCASQFTIVHVDLTSFSYVSAYYSIGRPQLTFGGFSLLLQVLVYCYRFSLTIVLCLPPHLRHRKNMFSTMSFSGRCHIAPILSTLKSSAGTHKQRRRHGPLPPTWRTAHLSGQPQLTAPLRGGKVCPCHYDRQRLLGDRWSCWGGRGAAG